MEPGLVRPSTVVPLVQPFQKYLPGEYLDRYIPILSRQNQTILSAHAQNDTPEAPKSKNSAASSPTRQSTGGPRW